MAREIMYNDFEISLVVFIPNMTTNDAITYTNWQHVLVSCFRTCILHNASHKLNSLKLVCTELLPESKNKI